MAILMQTENLTRSVGDRILFEDLSFGLSEGDKIGIVAKNGTGKSSLLSVLAGKTSPDSGSVTLRRDVRISFLPQRPELEENIPIINMVCAAGHDPLEAQAMLTRLGVDDTKTTLRGCSGGEKKRVALAIALLSQPDILMLDEPTNHIDAMTAEWLEGMLKKSRIALLMVTHDRYFLERVCNRIMEIDNCHAYFYEGNYDKFLEQRQQRLEAERSRVDKIRNTLRKEQEWMSRQPQARAGKAKYRIDRFYELKEQSRGRGVERNVSLEQKSAYIGSKIFEAKGVSKAFGPKVVLDNFSYTFARGEKVGIIGRNGVGKSTFIKMLMGDIKPDCGCFELGETVRFGYYSQEGISFNPGKKVIDAVTEIAEEINLNGQSIAPMSFLQRFLFSPKDQQKYISTLSGGEKSRLYLATVLMRNPNFLILDEPTNDLDIVTLGILEEYLSEFKGCAIVISHDRFFLDNVVDHLFVMTGEGKVKDFPGTYMEYVASQSFKARPAEEKAKEGERTKMDIRSSRERKPKLSYKERKDMELLEAELPALNEEKKQIEDIFQNPCADSDIVALTERYKNLCAMIDEKEMKWLELSEKA